MSEPTIAALSLEQAASSNVFCYGWQGLLG